MYDCIVIETAIGNMFDEYHLLYNKNAKNAYLSLTEKMFGELDELLKSHDIEFIMDVKSVKQIINYLSTNGYLTKRSLGDLKLQLLLMFTDV